MSLTIREKIIRQFLLRAEAITVAGGYSTNLGSNVFRATRSYDPKNLGALVIWPMPETATEKCYRVYECSMTMRVEGLAFYGEEDKSIVAERILGDMIRCFMSRTWTRDPELTTDIAYKGGGTDTYPEEEDKSVGAYAEFLVTYEMDLGEPEYEATGEIEESIGLSESQAGETDE